MARGSFYQGRPFVPFLLINGNREMGRGQIQIRKWLLVRANGLPSSNMINSIICFDKFEFFPARLDKTKPNLILALTVLEGFPAPNLLFTLEILK